MLNAKRITTTLNNQQNNVLIIILLKNHVKLIISANKLQKDLQHGSNLQIIHTKTLASQAKKNLLFQKKES